MDDLEFRRRVIEQWGISPDKYEGFEFGYIRGIKPQWSENNIKIAATPFIPVTGGHSIEWNDGMMNFNSGYQAAYVLTLYDANKQFINYSARSTVPRTVTLWSNTRYVKIMVDMDKLSGAYVKDVTTGEYLWRGSDYVE